MAEMEEIERAMEIIRKQRGWLDLVKERDVRVI